MKIFEKLETKTFLKKYILHQNTFWFVHHQDNTDSLLHWKKFRLV